MLANTFHYLKKRGQSVFAENRTLKAIGYHSLERILNPPNILIPSDEFIEQQVRIGSNDVTIKVLETSHGYYVKPKHKVYSGGFERMFGFGLGCDGFSEDRVVYYPHHTSIKTKSYPALVCLWCTGAPPAPSSSSPPRLRLAPQKFDTFTMSPCLHPRALFLMTVLSDHVACDEGVFPRTLSQRGSTPFITRRVDGQDCHTWASPSSTRTSRTTCLLDITNLQPQDLRFLVS